MEFITLPEYKCFSTQSDKNCDIWQRMLDYMHAVGGNFIYDGYGTRFAPEYCLNIDNVLSSDLTELNFPGHMIIRSHVFAIKDAGKLQLPDNTTFDVDFLYIENTLVVNIPENTKVLGEIDFNMSLLDEEYYIYDKENQKIITETINNLKKIGKVNLI